jgi:hypothetical protein
MLMRLRVSVALLSLVLTACALGSSEDESFAADRTNIAAEPTSLAELPGMGGGSYLEMTAEEIAAISDVVIEAVVVDVKKSRLNTTDGLFPTGAEIEAYGFGSLVVLTEVDVQVIRTLGATRAELDFAPGETITVTVGGGMYKTALDLAQIEAVGLAGDGDFSGAPPGLETEDPPEPGAEIVWGVSPDENLGEGDTVVILLVRQEIPGFAQSAPLQVLSPTHPLGVFHKNDEGQWVDRRGRVVDVETLGGLLGTSTDG